MTFQSRSKLKRGEVVTVRIEKDKSRPSVVVQSDLFTTPRSVTVIPITTTITSLPIRVRIQPSKKNGLRVKVDKITTLDYEKIGDSCGHIEEDVLLKVDENLTKFLGLRRSFSLRSLPLEVASQMVKMISRFL
ncbi:MAG: type II toxin-antitoxin system PemK/MazF family toxin [Acetobacter sp.]|nr:type II toxin-antitoxin system PemK/MazF family toxin [Acetobacter sp.]